MNRKGRDNGYGEGPGMRSGKRAAPIKGKRTMRRSKRGSRC